MLKQNTGLLSFAVMSLNAVNTRDFDNVLSGLCCNKRLQHLYIHILVQGGPSAKMLAEVLRHNVTLRRVCVTLSNNTLGRSAAHIALQDGILPSFEARDQILQALDDTPRLCL
jgi:hypothetical protein